MDNIIAIGIFALVCMTALIMVNVAIIADRLKKLLKGITPK
jgi:hypothetical protein